MCIRDSPSPPSTFVADGHLCPTLLPCPCHSDDAPKECVACGYCGGGKVRRMLAQPSAPAVHRSVMFCAVLCRAAAGCSRDCAA
eukprot:3099522-Alexandrium_andersonii.AAC.1